MGSYKPVILSGAKALAAGPASYISPQETLLSGPMLDASINRPGFPAWSVGVLTGCQRGLFLQRAAVSGGPAAYHAERLDAGCGPVIVHALPSAGHHC